MIKDGNYYHEEVEHLIRTEIDIKASDMVKKIIKRDNDALKISVDIAMIYDDLRRRAGLLILSQLSNSEKKIISDELKMSLKVLEFRMIEHMVLKLDLLNTWDKEHPELKSNGIVLENGNLSEEEYRFLTT